jgi:hypothetical protein
MDEIRPLVQSEVRGSGVKRVLAQELRRLRFKAEMASPAWHRDRDFDAGLTTDRPASAQPTRTCGSKRRSGGRGGGSNREWWQAAMHGELDWRDSVNQVEPPPPVRQAHSRIFTVLINLSLALHKAQGERDSVDRPGLDCKNSNTTPRTRAGPVRGDHKPSNPQTLAYHPALTVNPGLVLSEEATSNPQTLKPSLC